jgi:hypothetical protein
MLLAFHWQFPPTLRTRIISDFPVSFYEVVNT